MAKLSQSLLTTFDNPYDPFDDFDHWYMFDLEKGYNSCAYLARLTNISDQLSEFEKEQEIERAIDDIVKYDFLNRYRKVKRDLVVA